MGNTKRQKTGIKLQVKEGFFTEKNIGYILIAFSALAGLITFVMYLSSAPTSAGSSVPSISRANQNLLPLAMILALGPYSAFAWHKNRRINLVEKRFAEFLQDLAEYWKSGLSMTIAIKTLAKGDYGAMDDEIQKMNAQISWGIAFNEVLRQMSQRISTSLVIRSVSLIEEANRAGGRIADVLYSAAKDANEIKWLQMERERGVKMYIVVIYIAFGVYLAVIGIIVALFLPAIVGTQQQEMAGTDDEEGGGEDTGAGGGGVAGLGNKKISKEKLSFIFFSSVLVQCLGNGLMAGMMGEGKLSAGLRHVVVMVLLGWGVFVLLDRKVGLGFSGSN